MLPQPRLASISDAETTLVRDCSGMITATFLGRQPSTDWWSQRIIKTGEPYQVLDRHNMARTVLQSLSEAKLQELLAVNAELRWKIRMLLKVGCF